MKQEKYYYWMGFIVLTISIILMLADLRKWDDTNSVRLIENTLFVFVGLMLVLIGELVKKLSVLETNLDNINKILFPDNAVGGTPKPPERLVKALNPQSYDQSTESNQ